MVSGVDEDAVDRSTRRARAASSPSTRRRRWPTGSPSPAARRGSAGQRTLVLGCDSVLELDGVAFGKPADADRGGRAVAARCAAAVGRPAHRPLPGGSGRDRDHAGRAPERQRLASATVHFGQPTDAEIDAYVATGEPLRVAGAFTLDRLGGWFVDGIDGDPGTVLGLSLPLLRATARPTSASGSPHLWARPRGTIGTADP